MRSSIIRSFFSPNSKREQNFFEGIWPHALMACLTLNSFLKRFGIFHASLISSMEQVFYIDISILLFDFILRPRFQFKHLVTLPPNFQAYTNVMFSSLVIDWDYCNTKVVCRGVSFLCFVWQRSHRPTSISRNYGCVTTWSCKCCFDT